MGLLFDSFWRAAAYCLRPRVMLLSAVPLLLMALLALVLQHFYWDAAVQGMASLRIPRHGGHDSMLMADSVPA